MGKLPLCSSHLAVIVAAIVAAILDLAIRTASDQINSASIEFLDPINLYVDTKLSL